MTSEFNNKNDFEDFVSEFKSTVYSVCYMFADNNMQANDLFQEVLVNRLADFVCICLHNFRKHDFPYDVVRDYAMRGGLVGGIVGAVIAVIRGALSQNAAHQPSDNRRHRRTRKVRPLSFRNYS